MERLKTYVILCNNDNDNIYCYIHVHEHSAYTYVQSYINLNILYLPDFCLIFFYSLSSV